MPTVYAVETYIGDLSSPAFKKLEAMSIDLPNQKVVLPYGECDSYTQPMEQAYLRNTAGCPTVYVETLVEVVECLVATANSQLRLLRDAKTLQSIEGTRPNVTHTLSREAIITWLVKNLDAVRDTRSSHEYT